MLIVSGFRAPHRALNAVVRDVCGVRPSDAATQVSSEDSEVKFIEPDSKMLFSYFETRS